jgi:hypothetical protein
VPDVRADKVVDVAPCTPGLMCCDIDRKAGRHKIGGALRPRSVFNVGLSTGEYGVISTILGSHECGPQLVATSDPYLRARIHGSPLIYSDVDERRLALDVRRQQEQRRTTAISAARSSNETHRAWSGMALIAPPS